MEYISSILSLLFFIGALISLFWGIQIIKLNQKSNINRKFLYLCLALAVWSLGLAIANSSPTLEDVLFWRRFSALGWTSIHSIMLHFLILIANQEGQSKWGRYLPVLHIPALINMYIFAFSNHMAKIQYNIIKIDYGWTNIAVNNGWDYFYYIYFSLYLIGSLMVLWKWKNQIKEEKKLKQANLIFITILTTTILGGVIDLIANTFVAKPLPQISPLLILLPVWAMYYSAKNYNLFNIKKEQKEEVILSKQEQKNIFNNISLGFYMISILIFVFEYFSKESINRGNFKESLIKAALLIVLGSSVFYIQKIKKESLRERLTAVILVASIPLIAFMFFKYSATTVWIYPIIVIMSSLFFNRRTLLISATIVAIITQRLIWILRPASYALVNQYDYALRIGIFILIFYLGSNINRIYMGKIKENKAQIEFQNMISDILFEFVNFNQETFDEKVNYLLERIGRFFNVDRTYLFTIDHKNDTMTYSNQWCNTGIGKAVGTIEEIPLDKFPWWIDQLNKENLINITDVNLMPQEAHKERKQLQRQGVKSLLAVPVKGAGKLHAFIGIDSGLETRRWSEKKIELLDIMANILSSAISPIKTDQETHYMAYYDSLTKLPNRFLFADRVNQAIHVSKRKERGMAIIFIDLDGFKAVNDAIGHRGGDMLLKKVAIRLSKVTSEVEQVARFGGDKFMIMINNIVDDHLVTETADAVMQSFTSSFIVYDQEFLLTASAGIAMYPADGKDSDELIKNADIAMYKAKSQGKNQYAFCTKEMKDELQLSIELSKDLAYAVERNELRVYYQPQIDLLTNEIVGLEALLRWVHPTKGIISPGIFIPLAEQSNLINSIGEWVLATACRQNKKWQNMGFPPIYIAVNLSAVQVMNSNIAETIDSVIKETGLDPKYVELEITEGIAIEETAYVIDVLSRIKKTGVAISIDDFGTEYSSLSIIKLLPIDKIKIDMQFVQGIEKNEKDRAIIIVIINLANNLGLTVLAEGVETAQQLEFLKEEKCDYVQGYYFYRPMPADEIEALLRSKH